MSVINDAVRASWRARLHYQALGLACVALSHAHPGEGLENAQAEGKKRSEYLKKLIPQKRIVSCKSPDNLLNKQQVDERRRQALRTLQEEHDLEPSVPQPFHNEIDAEETYGLFQKVKTFISDTKGGWYGARRNNHKRDPSELAFARNNPAMGNLPRLDWESYKLGNTLVLAPSVTVGPYFVSGEMVRQNLDSGQLGIPLYLDIQVLDINTCQPIPNAAIDLWQANATGIYSGIDAFGNGLRDPRNIQNQALRGIQVSDRNGSVRFQTVMPGHYWPRTTHIHVMTTLNAIVDNSTISGGNVAHVKQIYFDQELNDSVFQVYPYSANGQIRIRNRNDYLVIQGSVGGADLVAQYVFLGNELKDGVFAWINFAIDPIKDQEVHNLAVCSNGKCKQSKQWWFES